MIVAAVDIGTNSVKMTVAEVKAGKIGRVLHDAVRVTRLGKQVDKTGEIEEEAASNTLDALREFARSARDWNAEKIAASGTSALRDAANGAQFVRQASEILGGSVEVISGAREAELTHAAVRADADLNITAATVLATMDIGGGSTEVVISRENEKIFAESLQLGAVRLTERALSSDPPGATGARQAAEIADTMLRVVPALPPGGIVVGSGGTMVNIAAMQHQVRRDTAAGDDGISPQIARLHGSVLTLDQIAERVRTLAEQTIAERREIVGLEPARADVILGGAIVMERSLRQLGATEIRVSVRGLRYGLLAEMARSASGKRRWVE